MSIREGLVALHGSSITLLKPSKNSFERVKEVTLSDHLKAIDYGFKQYAVLGSGNLYLLSKEFKIIKSAFIGKYLYALSRPRGAIICNDKEITYISKDVERYWTVKLPCTGYPSAYDEPGIFGDSLLYAPHENVVNIIDISKGKVLNKVELESKVVATAVNDHYLAVGTYFNVFIYSIRRPRKPKLLRKFNTKKSLLALSFSNKGDLVFTERSSSGKLIEVMSLEGEKKLELVPKTKPFSRASMYENLLVVPTAFEAEIYLCEGS